MIIKRILIALAILTSFALASCKKEKDYICACSDTTASPPNVVYHTIHDTKENAELKCSEIPTNGFTGCKIE